MPERGSLTMHPSPYARSTWGFIAKLRQTMTTTTQKRSLCASCALVTGLAVLGGAGRTQHTGTTHKRRLVPCRRPVSATQRQGDKRICPPTPAPPGEVKGCFMLGGAEIVPDTQPTAQHLADIASLTCGKFHHLGLTDADTTPLTLNAIFTHTSVPGLHAKCISYFVSTPLPSEHGAPLA